MRSVDNCMYAVISKGAYAQDVVAQSITPSPRSVGENHVLLSLELNMIPEFTTHIESLGATFEDEFIEGSGNVSLLTHTKALALLALYEPDELTQ